jgi:hypothetical protein
MVMMLRQQALLLSYAYIFYLMGILFLAGVPFVA